MLKTKTRTILLTILTLFFLSVFILFFVFILKNPDLSEGNISFIFVINVITIILILLLLLILVIKSVIRLIYQRRQKILGSKLKLKLVAVMLILVLIPTLPTYFIMIPLINNIFDVWKQKRIQDTLNSSIGISRSYLQTRESYLKFRIETLIKEKRLNRKVRELKESEKTDLVKYLKCINVDEFIFLDKTDKVLFEFPEGKQNEIDYIYLESFEKGPASLPKSELKLNLEKLIIYYPLIFRKQYVGMLIFTEHLEPEILLQIRTIKETSTDYRNLIKFGEKSYSFVLNIGFLIVSLVLLFLTFWIAFYVARQITIPVEELLQGTLKVSKGDLDVHVEVETTDELGLLVNSFNNMVRDIKELNIKNQEHTQFISSILQNIGTGVIAITPDRKVVEVNNSAKDLLKINSEERPENLKEYFEEESFHRLNKLVDECFKYKTECIHKELDVKVKGKSLNLHFAVTAGIESVSGGAILVFDDITHIIHLQKIEVWKDVATQLAHEIKNPLTPIKLSTQRVLKKYNEGADDFGEILNRSYSTIIQEVDNIKSLLDHFNAFAKLPPPSFQDYNLNQLISEVVDLFRNLENIKFIEEYDKNIPSLSLDKFQIKRVLKNIIDNSIESFLKKGKITISTMFNKSENSVLLIIEDNGKGMEKDEREKIFLPYFSTKEIGMGLGMAIVEKIISDHNGEIEVFSQPYKGTKVQIKFF